MQWRERDCADNGLLACIIGVAGRDCVPRVPQVVEGGRGARVPGLACPY